MKKRAAFTLVEMICVLAILAIFVVLIGQSLSNSLSWFQSAFEVEVIEEHFLHALDFMEKDIREASGIDQTASDVKDNWTSPYTNFLYLESVDPAHSTQSRHIIYKITPASETDHKQPAKERPQIRHTLYRAIMDKNHSGEFEPVANYLLNAASFRVSYFNQAGAPCAVGDEVYAIQIVLTGTTKQGHLVTNKRLIPLSAKPQ